MGGLQATQETKIGMKALVQKILIFKNILVLVSSMCRDVQQSSCKSAWNI